MTMLMILEVIMILIIITYSVLIFLKLKKIKDEQKRFKNEVSTIFDIDDIDKNNKTW